MSGRKEARSKRELGKDAPKEGRGCAPARQATARAAPSGVQRREIGGGVGGVERFGLARLPAAGASAKSLEKSGCEDGRCCCLAPTTRSCAAPAVFVCLFWGGLVAVVGPKLFVF